jgi:hypothetical protein
VRISSRGDELPWFFGTVSTGKTMMVHPMLAIGPRLGRAMGIEGRGEPGRLSGVTSPWDAQWKGVDWTTVGFAGPHAGEEAGLGLGHVKIEKKGRDRRGWSGRAQLPAEFLPTAI